MSDIHPTILPFTAIDGDNIVVHEWPLLNDDVPPRAGVLVLHTLEGYGLRMAEMSRFLVQQGFAVRSYDMFGHGESDGKRGTLPPKNRFVVDLCDMVDEFRRVSPKGMPIVLLGHGFSAILAGHTAFHRLTKVDSVVMISPSFKNHTSWWQRALLYVMPKIAPNLVLNGRPEPAYISHSQEEVKAFKTDPRRHHLVTFTLIDYVIRMGTNLYRQAKEWNTPMLLMYAGNDKIVDSGVTADFADNATVFVDARCFSHMYHEILREPDRQFVYGVLKEWLDGRYPAFRQPD